MFMDKITRICKSRYLYYVIFAFLCFGLYLFDLQIKIGSLKNSFKSVILFIFLFLIILGLMFLFIKKSEKLKKDFHKFYFVVVMILGISYIALAPAYTGSDEYAHFYRVYEITDGKLVTDVGKKYVGSELPKSLALTFSNGYDGAPSDKLKYRDELNMIKKTLKKNDTILYGKPYKDKVTDKYLPVSYQGATLYSPLQYIPQIIGVGIGKIFNLGPFFLLMLGRLFGLIFYALLTSYAIYLLPKVKYFAIMLLLTPVLVAGASTISADGFTNALIFLLIAFIINKMYYKKEFVLKEKIILGLVTLFVAVCKIVYLPIVFLLFFIPTSCYKNKREKIIYNSMLILIGIIINLIWLHCTGPIFDIYYTKSDAQKSFIFSHLIQYFFIIARSYLDAFYVLLNNLFFGNQLYHTQLHVYSFFSIAFVILIFVSLFNNFVDIKIKKYQKAIILFIILCILGLAASALYLQITSVAMGIGYHLVAGMQGRYYIPVIMLLMFLVPVKKKFVSDKLLLEFLFLLQIPVFLTMIVQFI